MPTYISIANLKGGTGKTTLTAWLGYSLYSYGYKVLIVDLDPQSHLSGVLTLDDSPQYHVFELLADRHFELQEISSRADGSVFKLLPSNLQKYVEVWGTSSYPDPRRASRFRREAGITKSFNYVIFDCPPDSTCAKYGITESDYLLIPSDGTPLIH